MLHTRQFYDLGAIKYDRMFVDKYVDKKSSTFARDPVISTLTFSSWVIPDNSDMCHGASLTKGVQSYQVNKSSGKKKRQGQTRRYDKVPADFPGDICFYYNYRQCSDDSCQKLHTCRKCGARHRADSCRERSRKSWTKSNTHSLHCTSELELSSWGGEDLVYSFRSTLQDGVLGRLSPVTKASADELSRFTSSSSVPGSNTDTGCHLVTWTEDGQDFLDSFDEYDLDYSATNSGPTISLARIPHDDSCVAGPSGDLYRSTKPDEPDVIYDAQQGFSRYGYYTPVEGIPGLQIQREFSSSFHANMLGSQLNLPGWIH